MTNTHHPAPAWVADLGDGRYKNPVLFADYSDPDVIRVGEDFYMTASSFNHMPGLPVLHSRDLVNWTLLGHAAQRLPFSYYDIPRHGEGIWAPSIRYHSGKFWIFVGIPDHGVFMTTAEDPAGPWAPLHQVAEAKGWIDTCPLWDDDGNAYLVHAFAFSRARKKDLLRVCRMAPDGTRLLDDGVIVFDGTQNHPTIEGPKFYKRNGYYYIFAPAGGVSRGWQTVLRSRSVYGPYEDRIVLHQGNTDINGPHQGGYVELESGESWFIHFQARPPYGRIVHMQPMRWVDDWPVMGEDQNGDGIGEPVHVYRKPNVGRTYPIQVPQESDDFSSDRLGLQWQWQANPNPAWFSLTEHPGHLRLKALHLPDGCKWLHEAPQLLLQKFPAESFCATAKLTLESKGSAAEAGLIVFGYRYTCLSLSQAQDGQYSLSLLQGAWGKAGDEEESVVWSSSLPTPTVYLRVTVAPGAKCQFAYSLDGASYTCVGAEFAAWEALWVGAKVGIFAVCRTGDPAGSYADFAEFTMGKA